MKLDKKRYKVYSWKNFMVLHWMINPALVINELFFGQRVPKISLEDKTIEGVVCVSDILKITIIYAEDDVETSIIKLTGKYLPEPNPNYEEITLNSPLGSAIYLKPIPSQTHYEVNERKITVEIKEKIIAE